MQLTSNEKITVIIERTLNLINPKLVNHGKRVAYRLFKELYPLGIYDDAALQDICMLGLLHDVGAYKTEDIDSILGFDKENEWNHAIYSYLFLKYFSPLKSLAPVLLFHHANHAQTIYLNEENQKLAQLLKRLDCEDVSPIISKEAVFSNCTFIDEDADFNRVFRHGGFNSEVIEAYIKMIVFSIDFRSPQTMLHTFAATHAAETLARLAGVDEKELEFLKAGAMLHDIGKMGTPIAILEGTSKKLSPADMEIMKNHVVLSEDVLLDCVSEKILNIAVNHHEKLNGQGYPKGLNEYSLAYLDRIMAVADVFSAISVPRSYQKAFTKEKAITILSKFRGENLLDQSIIELAITHFDEIANTLDEKSKPIVAAYEAIEEEHNWIHRKITRGEYNIVRKPDK